MHLKNVILICCYTKEFILAANLSLRQYSIWLNEIPFCLERWTKQVKLGEPEQAHPLASAAGVTLTSYAERGDNWNMQGSSSLPDSCGNQAIQGVSTNWPSYSFGEGNLMPEALWAPVNISLLISIHQSEECQPKSCTLNLSFILSALHLFPMVGKLGPPRTPGPLLPFLMQKNPSHMYLNLHEK